MDEGLEPPVGVPDTPAVEACPADPQSKGRGDALVTSDPDTACPKAKIDQPVARRRAGWATAAGREEEEARPFLIRMAEETTMRVGTMVGLEFVHARTLGRSVRRCLTNPGNYS
jgi:hypothetical protein